MNRRDKRKTQRLTRKYADTAARVMAKHVYDFDTLGRRIHINNPRAVSVLTLAYRDYFLSKSTVTCREISPEEATSFPRPCTNAANGVSVIAVTEDPDGALIYCIKTCSEPALCHFQRLAIAKRAAKMEAMLLAPYSGFPSKRKNGS